MKNDPKCLFCNGKLEATSVNISKGISFCYSLGRNQPLAIPSQDEITLKISCPKCGAYGEALGDNVSFKGNLQHPVIEIANVYVGKLMTGNHLTKTINAKSQPLNPSRRRN